MVERIGSKHHVEQPRIDVTRDVIVNADLITDIAADTGLKQPKSFKVEGYFDDRSVERRHAGSDIKQIAKAVKPILHR